MHRNDEHSSVICGPIHWGDYGVSLIKVLVILMVVWDWYIRCDDPDADDPLWTEPIRFADGCTLNKPIVLAGTAGSSGEWLLPVSLWSRDRIGPASLKERIMNSTLFAWQMYLLRRIRVRLGRAV